MEEEEVEQMGQLRNFHNTFEKEAFPMVSKIFSSFQYETLTTNEILACARNLQKDLLEAESFNYRSGNKSKLQ